MNDDYKLALDVIAGKYGNGATRKMKLGSKFYRIQKIVNGWKLLTNPRKTTIEPFHIKE